MRVGVSEQAVGRTARRLGAAAWWEERCFEVLGRWSVTAPEPQVAVHLAAVSRHHAWRSEVLVDRLPTLRELDAGALLAPPTGAAVAIVASLSALEGSVARMAVVQRVLLPRLVVAHSALRAVASPVSDAALGRWLDKVIVDLQADWSAGEAVLQGLLEGPDRARAAADATASLDAALAAAPGTLPPSPPSPPA